MSHQLLREFGHGLIEVDGEKYLIIPSFANISNIGPPREIVETINTMMTSRKVVDVVGSASLILQSCCDKDLPTSFIGETVSTVSGLKYKPGKRLGTNGINDIVSWALHCIKHGIQGAQLTDDESKGEPMEEFHASDFITKAATYFKMSYEEAAKMTMTQFVMRMEEEFPQTKQDSNKINVDGKEFQRFDDSISRAAEEEKARG